MRSSKNNVPVLAVSAATAYREPPPMPAQESDENSGLSLAQIGAILWAHRARAAIIAVTILCASALIAKLLPKTYSATATLIVTNADSDPLAGGGQAQAMPMYAFMSTEVQLMQSGEVLLPVIDRLKLTENKAYTSGYKPGDGNSLAEYVKEGLVKDLDIEPGRLGGQIIYVTASARDRFLAAQIANTLADVYLEQQRARTTGPASDRAKRYTTELAELKRKVSLAQDQLTAFRQRTGMTDTNAQNNSEANLLALLEQRLQDAQTARRAAEVKAEADREVGAGATASAEIQNLRSRLNAERGELAEMRATMGVQHPKVIELQTQIDANQRILDSEFNTVSKSAASELTAARQLEAKLQAAVQEQRNKVLATSRLQEDGTKYQLELESAQSVYKRALDGYDQIMFASGGHSTNVSLASRAVPPQISSKPNKLKFVGLGLVAGIALGLLGPLLYELFVNRKIRCRDDFERGFHIPVLMEFDAIPNMGRTA